MLRRAGPSWLIQPLRSVYSIARSTRMSGRAQSHQPASNLDRMLPYVFDLPEASLIYVDNGGQLTTMKRILSDACVIGIDTETKPTFVPKRFQPKPHPTSTVQIAVRDSTHKEHVFVVDLLAISVSKGLMEDLDDCLKGPLQDGECMKLGQGLTADLRELVGAYPTLKAFHLTRGVLEMHSLSKYLDKELINQISLKNLVKKHLHMHLDKRQQLSDWGKRPLSKAQIQYAACDALVLLRLYDAISCEIEARLCMADGEVSDTSTSASTTASDYSTVARNTMASLSCTVDCTELAAQTLVKAKMEASRPAGRNAMGLDLNNALLRSWQSQPQKEWLRKQQSQPQVIAAPRGLHKFEMVTSGDSVGDSGGKTVGMKRSNAAAVVAPQYQQVKRANVSSTGQPHQPPQQQSGDQHRRGKTPLGVHVVSSAHLSDCDGVEDSDNADTRTGPQAGRTVEVWDTLRVPLPQGTGKRTVFADVQR